MKTYFTAEYSARRPITVVAGLVLTAIGLCFAIFWIPQLIKIAGWADLLGALCALVFVSVFLGGGLFLLHKVTKNRKTRVSITSEGISYGGLAYSWQDISEIGVMEKCYRRRDIYCVARLHPSEIDLVVELLGSEGLDPEQIRSLFGSLKREVVPLHSHLRIAEPTQ
jgi:hypothetical protein